MQTNTPDQLDPILSGYETLSSDDKLTLLHGIYQEIIKLSSPSTTDTAISGLSPILFADFFKLSDEEQLMAMESILSGDETEYTQAYRAIAPNDQLLVWFTWARALGSTAIEIPSDLQPSEAVQNLLSRVKTLEYQEQIRLLREMLCFQPAAVQS
ncbi:MAG: hypothetical protein MUF49_26160 [Oculatellaceae cyanobacterium Prado106]|nr:hypothetical protein [Oculatellaceae cyanobacterium Prado106]